uniref:SlyX protein n=1 Tax=Caenorhabditis tropicalis TaxID=1561998 RepID=A0A1I7UF09_9PELO
MAEQSREEVPETENHTGLSREEIINLLMEQMRYRQQLIDEINQIDAEIAEQTAIYQQNQLVAQQIDYEAQQLRQDAGPAVATEMDNVTGGPHDD